METAAPNGKDKWGRDGDDFTNLIPPPQRRDLFFGSGGPPLQLFRASAIRLLPVRGGADISTRTLCEPGDERRKAKLEGKP
jgi:hypothetical protein